MAIDSVNSSTRSVPTNQSISSAATRGIMQKDDFLKLFLASLQYQDPSAPMETKDMMQQMSMLSQMEAIQNLNKTVDELKNMNTNSTVDKGVGYLGKEIEGTTGTGEKVKGVVSEVALNDEGKVNVIVNNKNVDIASIARVMNVDAYNTFQSSKA